MPGGIPSASPLDALVAQYFAVQVEGVPQSRRVAAARRYAAVPAKVSSR